MLIFIQSAKENIRLTAACSRYLMFAAVYISVKSVQFELAENGGSISLSGVFQNPLFLNLLVSLASTYVLYFVASFMFFEPWHMFTSVSIVHPFPLKLGTNQRLQLHGLLVHSISSTFSILYQRTQRLRLL